MLTGAAPITENGTPASHKVSQRSTGWRGSRCRGYSVGSLPCDAGCDPQDLSHAGHRAEQEAHPKSKHHQCSGARHAAGATSQQTANVEKNPRGLGFCLLCILSAQEVTPFFLLLRERALKPDTSRAEGGGFCTFCPQPWGRVLTERSQNCLSPKSDLLCKTPPSPLSCQSPSLCLHADLFYGVGCILFIFQSYLLIFGCAGSSRLCTSLLQLQ